MSMQNEGKGRNDDQSTRDGAGGAGSGDTGDIGAMGGPPAGQGSQQSADRSEDLLAGDTTRQEADRAFSGNQQSGQQASEQGAMPPSQTDDDQYDQGTVKRAP